jgi:hypothetical protein
VTHVTLIYPLGSATIVGMTDTANPVQPLRTFSVSVVHPSTICQMDANGPVNRTLCGFPVFDVVRDGEQALRAYKPRPCVYCTCAILADTFGRAR